MVNLHGYASAMFRLTTAHMDSLTGETDPRLLDSNSPMSESEPSCSEAAGLETALSTLSPAIKFVGPATRLASRDMIR